MPKGVPAQKGDTTIGYKGYVLEFAPGRPRAQGRGWVRQHVLRWEEANGPLPDGWVVHHRNGDKRDNRIENLEAMPAGEHVSKHLVERSPEQKAEAIRRMHSSPKHPGNRDRCVNGHEFTEENTYVTPAGARQCRRCNADRQAAYAKRKRERQNGISAVAGS